MQCLEYNLIAKDFRKNLHEQAPVHKSWRLMSELMANPNGHLQVINVIQGCQLTSHLNNHSLWNTNQNASPWYTDYFIPLICGFIRRQRQQKQGGIISPGSQCTKGAIKPTNTHYACSLQTHGYARFLDNEKSVLFPPDRCIFTALTCIPEHKGWPKCMPCGWADVTLEPTSVHLWCVGSTDSRICQSFCVLQHKPSKATLHLNDLPEYTLMVLFSLLNITQGTDTY